VFEFLLINHPLDCPVCDKGGECPLQDFSYAFGNDDSRMDFPRRTFDGEGVKADVDFGPTLMLNRNRCILCTRCSRFMAEVDGDAQIGTINRGNGSEIATFNEQGVHSILSGNLMDVCPVGAITTKQYRSARARGTTRTPWTPRARCARRAAARPRGSRRSRNGRRARAWRASRRAITRRSTTSGCATSAASVFVGRGRAAAAKPLLNTKEGIQQVVTWKDALMRVRDVLNAAGRKDPASVRMLASAHASHEEMFLLKRLAEDLKGEGGASHVHVAWRRTEKQQPANTKFRVPAIDAPNVNGAKDLGLAVTGKSDGDVDLSALRTAIDQGRVAVLYVVDPGPDGSMGDLSWIIDARKSGRLPTVIYQGVLQTDLARIADVVLPGSAWVEKDATYTNDQGMVQAVSKAINAPGESVEDWQILTSVAAALGLPYTYASSQQVRNDIATHMKARALSERGLSEGERARVEGYASLTEQVFNRPVSAEHWLKASNPMERWKWDTMFQDLPPVKGHNVQMEQMSQPTVIPLRLVTEEISRTSE
jgi:NADH-quinone oxidoreductase subunit G